MQGERDAESEKVASGLGRLLPDLSMVPRFGQAGRFAMGASYGEPEGCDAHRTAPAQVIVAWRNDPPS